MTQRISLEDIPVIDNHCHPVEAVQHFDVAGWRQLFTESPDPRMRERDVVETAFYRRLLRAMADFYELPKREDALLAARNRLTTTHLIGDLFQDARIGGVVVDTGYPAPEKSLTAEAFIGASGSAYVALLRLEVMFEHLVTRHASYDELLQAVREALTDVRAAGYAGFKSIVGYRTGLAIDKWPDADARDAFRRARAEFAATGAVRLGYKPLLDTLLHIAFEAGSAQELPVQFHVGYGDPDADLRSAAPLELRTILEDRALRGMQVVLLHGCWPYFRQGAYLAAVYSHVYLDLSYAIPFLSVGEMTSMTRAALGAAPFTKLMYSSDGVRVPELHWLGAHEGRRVLGTVLGELVQDGDLDFEEARAAGERILRGNAAKVYGVHDGMTR